MKTFWQCLSAAALMGVGLIAAGGQALQPPQRPAFSPASHPSAALPAPSCSRTAAAQQKVHLTYLHAPLAFIANRGQFDKEVQFKSSGRGCDVWLTPTEAVLSFSRPTAAVPTDSPAAAPPPPGLKRASLSPRRCIRRLELHMKMVGANPSPRIQGARQLPGKTSYFLYTDRLRRAEQVPSYAQVRYQGVYCGIDLVYYGSHQQLEYDWIVAPHADPSAIHWQLTGARSLRIDPYGALIAELSDRQVQWNKPRVYQVLHGKRSEVSGAYTLQEGNRVAFSVGPYDHSRPLVIDPTLAFSTYVGGSAFDTINAITVGSSNDFYVAGITSNAGWTGKSSYGGEDGFVERFSTTGTPLGAFVFGGNADDAATGIVETSPGNVAICGTTQSTSFGTPISALVGTSAGGSQIFLIGFNFFTTHSVLKYFDIFQGNGQNFATGIAKWTDGTVYVSGYTSSTNFANIAIPNYGGLDSFVLRLATSGQFVLTTFGGAGDDLAHCVAVDSNANFYVGGNTHSHNFPVSAGAFQTTFGGGGASGAIYDSDGYVIKFNPLGNIVYSTFLGGNGWDGVYGIAVDAVGDVWVTGTTGSTNFPVANALYPNNHGGYYDAFVTRLNAAGNGLIYSDYLGGGSQDYGMGIAIDSAGNAYVTGYTYSTDFTPIFNAVQPTAGGGGFQDAFVTKINAAGSGLFFSTYLGTADIDLGNAIAADSSGAAYAAGLTRSASFPGRINSYSGNGDGFVTKITP